MPAADAEKGEEPTSGALTEEMFYLHQVVAEANGRKQGRQSQGRLPCHRRVHLPRDWSLTYYGELGFGSLTKSGAVQQSGSAWAYLPIGLGVVLMVSGFVLAILDRRAR